MSQPNIRSQISFGVILRPGVVPAEVLRTVPEESIETADVPILNDQINDLNDSMAEFVATDVTVEGLQEKVHHKTTSAELQSMNCVQPESVNIINPLKIKNNLLNSSEFLDEQRKILLEFEARRARIEEEKHDTPTPPREPSRRLRRSSIGLKITCPICLENLSSVKCTEQKMVTECGHIFCKSCIEDTCDPKKGKNLCPVCRENVGQLRKVFI